MSDRDACPCCGERARPTLPDGEWACGCEWEGCDENCPVVGHLYREDRAVKAEAEADRLRGALAKIAHEAVDAPHARQIARDALDAEEDDR